MNAHHPTAHLDVVGAVIIRRGLVLCAQRGPGSHAGLWEFPGGKVEPGETPEQALRREISEELLCEVAVGELVADTDYDDGQVALRLRTFRCRLKVGEPQPLEHAALTWLPPTELGVLAWAPADLPTVQALGR